jgi:hypothetical protein
MDWAASTNFTREANQNQHFVLFIETNGVINCYLFTQFWLDMESQGEVQNIKLDLFRANFGTTGPIPASLV